MSLLQKLRFFQEALISYSIPLNVLRQYKKMRLLGNPELFEIVKLSYQQAVKQWGCNMRDTKAALAWIIDILRSSQIPFQISGGLAAKAYGATRELADIDIDIPDDKFDLVKDRVGDYIIFGPEHLKGEQWDLLLMTLNYKGQEIDISGAYRTKIFNKESGIWYPLITDFSKVVIRDIMGLQVPVIPRDELLTYKKILARAVDIIDIKQIESKFNDFSV